MTDVEDIAVDPDLTAARAIHMPNLLGIERGNQMPASLLLKHQSEVRAAEGGWTLRAEGRL
jgi:hypothetical protein